MIMNSQSVKKYLLLCNILKLSNLFVEISNVMFNNVGQLLYLYGLIIKNRFSFAQQRQFLQLCVSVSDVTADTLGNVDKIRIMSRSIPSAGHT